MPLNKEWRKCNKRTNPKSTLLASNKPSDKLGTELIPQCASYPWHSIKGSATICCRWVLVRDRTKRDSGTTTRVRAMPDIVSWRVAVSTLLLHSPILSLHVLVIVITTTAVKNGHEGLLPWKCRFPQLPKPCSSIVAVMIWAELTNRRLRLLTTFHCRRRREMNKRPPV